MDAMIVRADSRDADSQDAGSGSVRRFFTGAGFPACLLAAVVVYEVFLCWVIFGPSGEGVWGRFSEDFKRWCFSYDPRTGGMSWGAVWIMIAEPVFLAGITAALWRRSLGVFRGSRGWLMHGRALGAGAVGAAAVASVLFLYGTGDRGGSEEVLPFPGERIRTQIVPPAMNLTDHRGAPVSLEALRGRVVLLTGVYATCSTACPQILRELKSLMDTVPADQRSRFAAVALSLNPEYDTSEMMTAIAAAYGFSYPEFRYANGPADEMHELLTRLQFAPTRNAATGAIDHANLFLLVDAQGRIAYRFNLLERHKPWLHQATAALLKESQSAETEAAVAPARP